MKKILFLLPNSVSGSPALERVNSFIDFYQKEGFYIEKMLYPSSTLELIKLLKLISSKKVGYIFISQPPFKYSIIFAIPFLKKIVDYRDGWSIAQESGYGGIAKKNFFKAKLSRVIEFFVIRHSYCAITCTPGLDQYLSKISSCKLLLIPNGINDKDLNLINDLKSSELPQRESSDSLTFCCAGKFSEYGKDKVKILLQKIVDRYEGKDLKILLIGSNEEENNWVKQYFSQLTFGGGSVEILPRMEKIELFTTMLNADFGLTILRDPSYELGTKVYDYIALGLPIINYFDQPNNFTNYFDAFLDVSFNGNVSAPEIRRNVLIERELKKYFEGNIL